FGGMPGETTINLSTSTSLIMPRLTNVTDGEGCQNNAISLSAATNANTILWYASSTSTTIINTGLTYNPTLSTTTTFWVLPVFNGCTTGTRSPIVATVNPLPEANNITIFQCDDSVGGDCLTVFNINTYFEDITGGQTTNRDINYFFDVALTQAINGDAYNNVSNPQTIYAQVINISTGCEQTSEVLLQVNNNIPNNAVLVNCYENAGNGLVTFTLTDADLQVLSGFPAGLTTAYYLTYDDALLDINQLPNTYTNVTPFNQIIYAKVLEADTCYVISEVMLEVNQLPIVDDDQEVFYCLNISPETITLSAGLPNPNYAYNWSTGEVSSTIEVNQIGVYTVEVTDNATTCSKTKTITVLASDIATIESVDIVDTSQNNSITVNVTGQGTYQYALNENGPYQESNMFTNVTAGVYTVYVKDIKNNCGTVTKQVFVIGYPSFFTPNNDTYNDTWQIKGLPANFQLFRVNIYNRYGKLLYTMDNPSDSWDGTYNGIKLPTSDYWFTAFLDRGKHFKGHFTLKND
ncbi:MAG: T9SS type B sorting domain-containing protein, partial [Olleya sp.]